MAEALESVKKQRYPHRRIYLIGDDYQPADEFRELSRIIPKEKILAYNLKGHQPERTIFRRPEDISRIAGNTASNFCLDLMESTGIRFVANLDDDDLWSPYHLEYLREEFVKFPMPAMVCTMANFHYKGVLPAFQENKRGEKVINTLAANVAHSAVAWDLRRLPLRYRRQLTEVAWNRQYGDADMWKQIEDYCHTHNYATSISHNLTVEVR